MDVQVRESTSLQGLRVRVVYPQTRPEVPSFYYGCQMRGCHVFVLHHKLKITTHISSTVQHS